MMLTMCLAELPAPGKGFLNANYDLFFIITFCPGYKQVVCYPRKKLIAIQADGGGKKMQINKIHKELKFPLIIDFGNEGIFKVITSNPSHPVSLIQSRQASDGDFQTSGAAII